MPTIIKIETGEIMDKSKKPTILGYASGIGAGNHDCSKGPDAIRKSNYFSKINDFIDQFKLFNAGNSVEKLNAIPEIAKINDELAKTVSQLVRNNQFFITLGGDNCCSIGTWSGAAAAKKERAKIGLIWIDAHMDSHTPDSSHSKNVHGMPLAALLGFGDERLTNIMTPSAKVQPENVVVIGARSYEAEEKDLLDQLNVKIYYMSDIEELGLDVVLQEAIERVNKHASGGYGICLDLDVIDPEEAPGVGSPEPNGIPSEDVLEAFDYLKHDRRLLGLEIVEFNPVLDKENKTEKLIVDLIKHFI